MFRANLTLALWVLLAVLGFSAPPARAQAHTLALLVVVPEQVPLDAIEVDRWMDQLKVERERQRLSPEQLPLLRLSLGRAPHRAVLERLGVAPGARRLRTFTCRRDDNGWPSEILAEHEAGTAPDQILARFVQQKQAPQAATGGSPLGLLLVGDAESQQRIRPFLEELGRFWLQRYGRVNPTPYPLASYDISQPEVAQSVARAFPSLVEGKPPVVALCLFEGSQPVEVLQVFRDLEMPATLVREISSARGQAMVAESRRKSPSAAAHASAPAPNPVGLSVEQERVLLVSRLNETAQQLWNGAKDDKSLRNQGPKRILLRVIEESRGYLAGEAQAQARLLESLRDYQVEPLRLERDSGVFEQAARLLELTRSLLDQVSP